VSKASTRKPVGSKWVEEIEREIESLRDTRAEIRRRLNELDLEGEALWEDQESRWRRLELKLRKLMARSTERVHPGLATNIENLVASLDETYQDLDSLLD